MAEAKYGNRFPDLVMTRNGRKVVVQVGRATKSQKPVIRERRAIDDLNKLEEFDHVFFIKYLMSKK